MKALIASGGRGTRLRPITHTRNKHLIPIANKPILHYAIEAAVDAGITEIGIVVNADSDEVPQAIGDGHGGGSASRISPRRPRADSRRSWPWRSRSSERTNSFSTSATTWSSAASSGSWTNFEKSDCNCFLTLAKVKDPERFGVPEIRDGQIVGVEEKPKHPKSNFAVAGIYLYDSHIFEAVNAITPSARGELEISDAHQYLIDKGFTIGYTEITGWWKDTGKPTDLLEANRLVLDNITPGHPGIGGRSARPSPAKWW